MQKLCLTLFLTLGALVNLQAQKREPLPHGMTYGKTVNARLNIPSTKLDSFMGNKTRITTTITGTVLKIDTPKGGWFSLDAGKGGIIKVHFQNYGITLPLALKGRQVMIEGVAARLFTADDMQHYAGDNPAKKQQGKKAGPKQSLSFEATGLMVL